MRKLFILLTIIVILPLFTLSVSAEDKVDEYIERFDKILPDTLSGITQDADKLTEAVGIESIFADILSALSGGRSEAVGFFLSLVGITALLAMPLPFGERISASVTTAVGVVGAVMIFSRLSGVFTEVSDSLSSVSNFFTELIPVAVGVTSLGGGVATAGVQAAGMYTTVSLVGRAASSLLLPMVGFGFAMSLLSAFGNEGVASLTKGIKSLFMWLIGIMTALIGGTLSLQTMISAAQDSAAMRAARYMASGLIPVVGSTVSGALSTLAAGVSYAKGVIGAGAIAAIISIIIAPLVSLLAFRLALSVATMLADAVGADVASGIFTAFRFSLDTLTAVYALSSIIYILEIILFAKVGVALL